MGVERSRLFHSVLHEEAPSRALRRLFDVTTEKETGKMAATDTANVADPKESHFERAPAAGEFLRLESLLRGNKKG